VSGGGHQTVIGHLSTQPLQATLSSLIFTVLVGLNNMFKEIDAEAIDRGSDEFTAP
jgi:hypothetical protein